jgi:exodeoxyribonuclease VIII
MHTNTPDPGIYPDVPAEVYHSWDAASASRLNKLFATTAKHVRNEMEHPTEPTPAMRFGSACHTAILEPLHFAQEYTISEYEEFRSTEAKSWKAEMQKLGRQILTREKWAEVQAVALSARSHPAAKQLLDGRERTELSIVWDDLETGVRCKGRIDGVTRDPKNRELLSLLDLKTTADASPEGFASSIHKFGYHRQCAFYCNALAAHGVSVTNANIIAVETSAPFAVAVYEVRHDVLEIGRNEMRELLLDWRWFEKLGQWPGYSDEIQEIALPDWAMRRSGL